MHRSHSPPIRATSTGLFGTLQLATLVDGVLPIPPNLSVAIEIGASDRDTLDTELLASSANWFAVSLEPLVDKYARGLTRRPSRKDAFQALGHHHDRGIILPFAVANVPRAGAPLTLNVGANSGCSSTLPVDLKSNRLKWCRKVIEAREVPAVPLERICARCRPRPTARWRKGFSARPCLGPSCCGGTRVAAASAPASCRALACGKKASCVLSTTPLCRALT